MSSNPHRKRLRRRLVRIGSAQAEALKSSLEERHQSRVPVAYDEDQQERHREVVLIGYRIVNRGCKVTADEQFDPGNDAETLAVFRRLRSLTLLLDAILRRSLEGALDAEERLKHRAGIGHGEADAERHEERQVEEGLEPCSRIELFLRDKI